MYPVNVVTFPLKKDFLCLFNKCESIFHKFKQLYLSQNLTKFPLIYPTCVYSQNLSPKRVWPWKVKGQTRQTKSDTFDDLIFKQDFKQGWSQMNLYSAALKHWTVTKPVGVGVNPTPTGYRIQNGVRGVGVIPPTARRRTEFSAAALTR